MLEAILQVWLAPVLPLVAAAVTAVLPRSRRRLASGLAIGAMAYALGVSLWGLGVLWTSGGEDGARLTGSMDWLVVGGQVLRLGWVLDPLSACMLLMVSVVGLLIFIYSTAYMAEDANYTRFFCFLSLFAAAMLGLVIANSLLLLFVCWELVGLASYLLIGFWHHKPEAAAAAKKAFITTRIGDLGFLLGMVWLYGATGTLEFYDGGRGCLESEAVVRLASMTTSVGLAASTAIGLLVFCGAVGKSGQLPLHVWLPDAMEGPTPVSALIHAATMVAAGVFLVARMYPLMAVVPAGAVGVAPVLAVVTWVGALTAVFAALVAVAQTDIKRILAYSTISQLGYMFVGLGTGGVAVGMFHLITHAFFKALLFLGAGSVIHGCHEEQDIRRMGGLRRSMPVTFATYAVGMLALCGVPIFAGFWSKDAILHAAHGWSGSQGPFGLALVGAVLTAFYMTRQVVLVFFGARRAGGEAHESCRVMTVPLGILAVFAVVLGCVGTPFAPWFQEFLVPGTGAEPGHGEGVLGMMAISVLAVGLGLGAGWRVYGRMGTGAAAGLDPLEAWLPRVFGTLRGKFWVDELYARTLGRAGLAVARGCHWVDAVVLDAAVNAVGMCFEGLAWLYRLADECLVNGLFDRGCRGLREGGAWVGRQHDGRVQHYLRALAVAVVTLLLLLTWGCAS